MQLSKITKLYYNLISYKFKSFQIVKMADIIRVKAKKQFEWDQDNKFIFVKVPMPGHTIIKNLQIYLSDLILRITSKQKKSSETLDLFKQVEYLSPENKFTFIDGILHATLKKKNQGQRWDSLVIEDISLAQLKTRRKQSEARYEQNIKEAQELKQKLKTQYDRKATQQYMRFEQQQRKKLQKKKQDEKEAALNEVFRNVNQRTGKIEHEQKKWQEKGLKALEQLQKQQQQEYERQKQARRKAQQQKYKQSKSNTKTINRNNQIFDQEDIVHHEQLRSNIQEEIQQIPIRKEAKVSVKFTEKLYPNVATRDYHYTQPPMPKNSVPLQPNRQGDLQSRNPLWLKDRADGFMKMKNYSAALDAYNEAIKIDPTQRKILMNRSLAHMKLLNFDSALTDCQSILLQMQKQLLSSQQSKSQSLIDLLKIKTRKALCLAYKGNISTSKKLLSQQIEQFPQMPEQMRTQIQDCLKKVQKRQQSIKIKLKGDQFVKRNAYAQAIQYYDQAIAIDGNQYALSNKGLCLNKCARFQEAVEVCARGVRLVEECMAGASAANKANPDFINILLKLLYRKSTAHQSLNQPSQSQQSLRQALTLCPQDKDIKSALSNLLSKKQEQEFNRLKSQATDALTKQNNAEQALTIYGKCLKLVESADKIQQYLSILQNQCVCYLKLQQYDHIIACSIRILNLVNNYKGKIVEFGGKKVGGLNKDGVDKIVVRTLVRRANAYLKTGQVYNAKSDLEKAAEVDPKDPNVTKELQKLKQSLGTQ